MEQKDQRLEVRIPELMVKQLDEIRSEMDFTPSRSDLVRTFIERGIADLSAKGLYGGQVKGDISATTDEIPFASRLLLYFQIAGDDKGERWDGYAKLEYGMREIISQMYTKRWFWIAKLDKTVLKEVHNSFSAASVLSLLDNEPVKQICDELIFVLHVQKMFDEICDVMNPESLKYRNNHLDDYAKECLAGIKKVADIKSIPLIFYGFLPDQKRLIQMYEFVELANKPEPSHRTYIRNRYLTSAEDLRENYAIMLKVFEEIKQDGRPFDYESLDSMITKITRMPEWPFKLY